MFIYKARLTVKGCNQKEGRDFYDTFAPVASLSSLRLILSVACSETMDLWQLDVSNAFANATLEEQVFMKPPPQMGLPSGNYLKLLRSLYGLKQSGRNWNLLLSKYICELGFKQCISETCLLVYLLQ